MAETKHVAPPVLPTEMVVPLPAWSVFDYLMKKRKPSSDQVISCLVG